MARKKKQSFVQVVTSTIRNRLISGLLVLVPLGITVFIMNIILSTTMDFMYPVTSVLFGQLPRWAILALSIFLLLSGLYLVGLLTTHVIGRKIISVSEWFVTQIPFVKSIYSSSKQVIDVFQARSATGQRQVIMVEFPSPGLRAIGFLTGTISLPDGRLCYKIFIPTTPNPTTGFMEIVDMDRAQLLDMTTDEAFKIIMSGGFLSPGAITPAGAVRPEDDDSYEETETG